MTSVSMISSFFEINKTKPILKRTRASTKKLLSDHKFEFIKVQNGEESQVSVYNLDGRKHEIHVDSSDEEIMKVSCEKCPDFCFHSQILLTLIENKLRNVEDTEKGFTEGFKAQGPTLKRQKINDENDSKVVNSSNNDIQEPIKLVKRKKEISLPQDILQQAQVLKMENLVKSFGNGSFSDFHDHCVQEMNKHSDLTKLINELTVDQADTNIWHELRIGRITASRLHETARCTMTKGSLVDKFLGKKSGWSFAMMRGTVLEEFVFEVVKKEFPDLQRAGLVMNQDVHPFFAASPDGIHKDFVLEIKCPEKPNTFIQYTDINKLSMKYFAQIQLQMFITGRSKALLAVANLDFEKTRNITKIWIPLDNDYIQEMIEQANDFYEKSVFPAMKRKFLK